MKEKLEFDNPKMMDEAVWKARICYQMMMQEGEGTKNWTNKKWKRNLSTNKGIKNASTGYLGQKGSNGPVNRNQQKYRPKSEVK